jgi:predicted O-methyltransferase YrrM
MSQETWTAVDRYIETHLLTDDPVLKEALAANAKAGLPPIDVSPAQGKFLQLLATIQGARRVLEIGTLGGYSTICLGRALPSDGMIISLEATARHAEVARANIAKAKLRCQVEVRVGLALETLPKLQAERLPPFDLVFIDADKENSGNYLEWAMKLTQSGSVIICDNVVRSGALVDANNTTPPLRGTRELFERMENDPKLSATAIQTVGLKGYDGFAIARVL